MEGIHIVSANCTLSFKTGYGYLGPSLKAWRKLRVHFHWTFAIEHDLQCVASLGVLAKWHKGSHFVGLRSRHEIAISHGVRELGNKKHASAEESQEEVLEATFPFNELLWLCDAEKNGKDEKTELELTRRVGNLSNTDPRKCWSLPLLLSPFP